MDVIAETRRKFYNNEQEIKKTLGIGGAYEQDVAFSDIISALTEGKVFGFAGHSEAYWKADADRVSKEIFANLSAMRIMLFDAMEVMV